MGPTAGTSGPESVGGQPGSVAGDLRGVRVVELASYVTGPFAGAILGDLGATVIKVEAPPHGDPFRRWGSDLYSPTFWAFNRNKQSIVLDLGTEAGKEVLWRLLAGADVLIENFRPGVAERLGFGYDTVRIRNPALIYCSVTGFGDHGPDAHRPGYDTVGQAMSGLLSLLTDLDMPQPMGFSLADHLTGLYAACGILAALAVRFRTGEGQQVKTSLLQATLHLLGENLAHYFVHRESVPTRWTRVHQALVFAFVAGDGKPFVVHLSSPEKFWEGLLQAVGRPEWAQDPRFRTRESRQQHYDALASALQDLFRTADRSTWLQRLCERDVPCAPLNTLAEAVAEPQVQAMELVAHWEHPDGQLQPTMALGFSLSGQPKRPFGRPPRLGEHTQAILAGIGATPPQVEAWARAGAFGAAPGERRSGGV